MSDSNFSYASLSNLPVIEDLYERYLADPQSVDPSWRYFFEGMAFASRPIPGISIKGGSPDLRIYYLVQAYRTYGHLLASFNPIATHVVEEVDELNLEKLGFDPSELDASFPSFGFLKEEQAPLRQIVDALKRTYCNRIGVEYMGLGVPEIEAWLQNRIEPNFELGLTPDQKISVMRYLNKAELFEVFLHTKYVGQKRFSLEGGETLIPMLATIIEEGAEQEVKDVVLGMAHRGRLNVLANILNKSYAQIFHEFEDHFSPELMEGTGDVKYHKGFSGSLKTSNGKEVAVTLSANPSHLEAVDPVVEGAVRAQQELKGDRQHRKEVVPILLHGDAAISGQGVVYETLQFCRLNGYSTGGTLHIVINNQIGFTTLPKDSRSTRYCTDIAKGFGAPVFHVNAEDPEGCIAVAKLAIQMRQIFQCDVFIDLNCYRKYGHNEGDEPTFTQPLEYQLIKKKKSIREIFRDQLISEKVLDEQKAQSLEEEFKKSLTDAQKSVQEPQKPSNPPEKKAENLFQAIPTSVDASTLISLSEKFCSVPKEIQIHPKIQKLFQDRLAMVKGDPTKPLIDWGMGEHLAFATLCNQGVHVRLSGQDCRRGTFSHRHAVVVDQAKEEKYFPLSHLHEKQGLFDVFNSCLSEYAVLGFEFGYSLFYPNSLVLWEGQFGDFANGAQIIIDQFIATSEQKWNQNSNLTLLLPHGYEGQGPEHSSGRMERFLQLAGENNIQVANCTTPAQFFHLLRRQAIRETKKPLIVFTPKAYLRHPLCQSPLNDFTKGSFQEILDDLFPSSQTRKLILCSGKIYFELLSEREKRKVSDITLLRVEQLYPLHEKRLQELFTKYQGFKECVWVQEEHSNMGAWEFIRPLINKNLKGTEVKYVGRGRSASPAAGSYALHKKQHADLLQEAFT